MIYTITNRKGGEGKSTTAAALIAGLTLKGYKVLGIDLDPQSNLTYIAGADAAHRNIADVLLNGTPAEESVQATALGDLIAAGPALANADNAITETGKEYKLREALEGLKSAYDYIIIDTQPALNILTVNALTAADAAIIPAQADVFSLQGIAELAKSIYTIKKYCNPALVIEGILLTRFNGRTAISRDIKEKLQRTAEGLNTKVFSSTIREAVAVREAHLLKQSIFAYAPKSKVAEDYRAFVDEIIEGKRE